MSKKYTTDNITISEALNDGSGVGTSGQVLSSTGSGVSWIDGSGIVGGPYLALSGGTLTGNVRLNDSVQLQIGSSNDAYIIHNGTNTYFVNGVGNLEITNDTNDGDIIFKSDNGSGGLTTYFFLDGGSVATQFSQRALFIDNIAAEFGSSRDLKIYHDGSNSYVENDTGDLYIRSNFQDRDIVLQSDNGAGGTATYIQIDGSTGAVDLNHYGTKKLETTSTGVEVTGNLDTTGSVSIP